jgi:hypothetical protein
MPLPHKNMFLLPTGYNNFDACTRMAVSVETKLMIIEGEGQGVAGSD